MEQSKYFAIVTFGTPAKRFRRVHTDKESAVAQAATLKGSGTCSTVDVIGFATRAQAAKADISTSRGGEFVVRF
jgi:hypothetical protein